jgi:hypothetical protein
MSRLDIVNAYEETGSLRAAAALCGTAPQGCEVGAGAPRGRSATGVAGPEGRRGGDHVDVLEAASAPVSGRAENPTPADGLPQVNDLHDRQALRQVRARRSGGGITSVGPGPP